MAASVKTARCPLLKRNRRPRKGANLSGAVPRLSPAAHQGTSPVVDDVSRGFVQRLAANEPRTRRRALASLRKFLRVKSAAEALPSSQQLFLWKGLFYALWQQDKPLLQEELIVSICSLLHELQTETTQLEFTEAYWLTVKREWNGIDHFRLDKFYLLVRTFLAQTFVLLRRTGWDKRLITRFLSPLSLIVLGMERGEGKSSFKCKKEQGPRSIEEAAKCKEGLRAVKEYSNGLRFHVAEIFMKELNQAARNLPEDAVLLFLEPFVHVLATTEEDLWMDVVCQTVFKDLLNGRTSKSKQRGNAKRSKNVQVKESVEREENEEIADDSFDEDVDYEGHQLQVSYSEVSQLLLHSAAQPEVRQKNRRRMYKIAQRLRSVTVGFAVQKNESYIGELLCRRKEDQMARKRKRKEEEIAELKGKNKKRRKRTKQKKKAIERLNEVVGVVETEGQLKEVKTGEAERDELRKKRMGGDGEEAEEEEEEEEEEEAEKEEEEDAEAEEEEEEHEEAEAEEEHEAESEEEEEHEAESEEEEEHEAESEEEEEHEAESEEEEEHEAESEEEEEHEAESEEEEEEEHEEAEAEEEEEDHEAAAAGEAEEAKVEGSVLLEVGRVKMAWKSQEGSISANLKPCNSEKRVKFRLKKNQTTEYSPFIPLNLKKRTLVPFDPNTPTPRGVLKVGRHRT